MNTDFSPLRATVSNPLVREVLLVAFLLVGGHVVGHITIGSYVSWGAAIPIAMGLLVGVVLRTTIDDERSWVAFAIVFVAGLAGVAVSWVASSALFGATGESGRIPGFMLSVLLGSVLVRAWNFWLQSEPSV